MNSNDIEIYKSNAKDSGFLGKLSRAAKRLGHKSVKKTLLLYYVMKSKDVAFFDKAKICAALGYFVLPLDFVADFVPFVGYGDDILAIAWALHSIYTKVTPEIDKEAENAANKLFNI